MSRIPVVMLLCLFGLALLQAPVPAHAADTVYFSDNFENGLDNWIVSGQDWGLTTAMARSGSNSATDSPGGNYIANGDAVMLLATPLDLSGSAAPVLSFWHRFDIPDSGDICSVDISTDNGVSWATLYTFNNTTIATWRYEQIDVSGYRGSSVLIRFRLKSNSNATVGDGWYLDDVAIKEKGAGAAALTPPFFDNFESGLGNWLVSGQDWALSSASARSASHSLALAPYAARTDAAAILANNLDLSAINQPMLTFWHKYDFPDSADYGYVQVSTDGGTNWSTVATYTNATVASWGYVSLDLSSYRGAALFKLRFHVVSDSDTTVGSWYLDDVKIAGAADTTAPNNASANFINLGAASTGSPAVTLNLAATDNAGVTAYYASEDPTTPAASTPGWVPVKGTTPNVAMANLKGYWHLNGDWKDYSGNGNHLAPQNSAGFTAGTDGVFAQAGSFNGSNQYAKADAVSMPTGSVVTVSAWVYPTGYPNATSNGIVSWGNRSSADSFTFGVQNNGRLSVGTWGNDFVPATGPALTMNAWNHVAAVLNGVNVSLYVNGQSVSGTLASVPNIQSKNFEIGSTMYTAYYFQGRIDEVAVFNRAMSAAEIAAMRTGSFLAPFTLSSGDGAKTVNVWFADAAGNISSAVSDTIALDTTAPINPSSVSGFTAADKQLPLASGNWYNYGAPYFEWSGAADTGSGIAGYYVYFGTDAAADPATAGSIQATANYTAGGMISGQTYYLRIKAVNNAGTPASDTLTGFLYKLDLTPPGVNFSVNFENGVLDPKMSVITAGSFSSSPGIKPTTAFGSAYAFGFGKSVCSASCFDSYNTKLRITFPVSTYVSAISYKSVELNGNWGSSGSIYLDGVASSAPSATFGGNAVYSQQTLPVNKYVTTIEFKVTDITSTSEIFIDDITIGSGGSVVVNGNLPYTSSTSVSLAASCSDFDSGLKEFIVSENSSFQGASWQKYSANSSYIISGGDGAKTIYVKFKDMAGNESAPVASNPVTLDTTKPNGSISIDSGAQFTNLPAVTLTLAAADTNGVAWYFVSESSTPPLPGDPAWVAIPNAPVAALTNLAVPFTFSGGDGIKTVYAWFKDLVGNISTAASSSILLDTTPPTGTITISNGAASTRSIFATLNLTCSDTGSGCDKMQFSNDNQNWSPAESFAATKQWELSVANGIKTVWAKFQDKGGAWSTVEIKDTIVLSAAFSDDMESGRNKWLVDSNWAQITTGCHSGTTCWTSSPSGSYTPNMNANLKSVSFSTVGLSSLRLSFWHKYALASYNDYAYVEVSKDNGATWQQVAIYGNYYGQSQPSWTQTSLDISTYAGFQTVLVRFRLQTDGNGYVAAGWSIDDVIVQESPNTTALPFKDDVEGGGRNWFVSDHWSITTSDRHSGNYSWTSSPDGNYLPSINAGLTSVAFSTIGYTALNLSFWHKYVLASYNDYAYVEISKDNGSTWDQVAVYGNYYGQSQTSWTQTSLDLISYIGLKSVSIRFRLQTDSNGYVAAGWNIDDVSITGVGVPDQYQLNAAVTPVGAGTINSSPAGISCGADCTETYPSGTVVTLDAASTAAAATFAGWTGSCAGLGSCIVTMDQVKNVTALFDVNGVCGGSNGQVLATVPTSALCDSGSPSDISGTGPWNWSCIGVNKGSTAYCATATVGGHGTANLTAVATQGAIFGQGVTLSGTLKDGSTSAPLAGKSISIVPVSPAGSRLATQSATTLSDGSWSILMTPAVVDTAGDWNTQVGFAGDPSYNPAKVDAPFTISKADTTLTIVASAGSVSPTGTITVTGMISSAQAVNRSGLPIIATFTEPDGTTGHQITVFTSDQYGHYSAPYSAFGSKSGQWTISARFAGNNDLNAGISASLNLTVAQSAGYAILIQGDYGGTYRGNYTRSMDDIYRRLKNHSFTDDNIRYLSYDAGHANVDQLTTRQNVADAITTWAYDRIKAFGVAPLYIIMMDHGSPGGIFHIDPETITPADLDGWLDTLESRVMTDVGQALTSVIVNGSCYSGSFIPGLSKSGRVIVTSSDAGDQSIQGPSVNGNYFGEYFIYYLFQSMDGGNTLGAAFQSARESTFWQKYPIGFNGLEESPIVSWQRPQIDYGGSPALQALRLGIGSNSATLGWQVIPATTTVMSGSSVTLTAETKDLANTASAWVEVRKPSYTPPAPSSDGGQVNLALPKVLGTHDLTGWHFNLTAATELTETGTYTLYLYAMDAGGDVTDPVPVTLYVDSAANNAPNPFTLITPASGASISDQFLIFTWNETGDPDADPVSFTLKISDDSNGTKGGEAQRYESIPQGNYYLDVTTAVRANGNPLFVSGTNYWWEVTAVDNKGRTTTSGASRFKSTFSNALSGIITGYVANAAGAAISGASISVAGGATYKSLSNGKYLMLLSPEMMQLSASAAGYTSSAPVSVAVTSGNVITQNFILSSVNALNGACGGAAGGTFPTAPDSNLCNPGNPTPATGNAVTHTWNWNCAGSNGGSTASCSAYQDTTPPALSLSTLADGARTNNATLNISGTVTDAGGVKSLTIDGTGVPLGANGSFSQLLTLTAGANLITSVATDTANNSSTDTRTITLDQTAPVLTISAPADNSAVHTTGITLSGQVDESSTAVCSINGAPAQGINMSGNSFSLPVTLATNQVNTISVTVTDLAGNQATVKRTVTSDETAPSLAVTDPAQDITVRQGSYLIKGSVSDNFSSFSQVSVNSDGQLYTPAVTNGAFAQPLSFTTAKTYAVTVSATDAAGNTATVQRNILYSPQATIDLGSASGIRGKTVTIPITLNNPAGTPLSTVRVDIGYDPALLTKPGAVLGAASAAAGKSLDASDQGGGVFRVGLYDTGNTVLASGILANVTFTVAESAAIGSLTPLTNTPLASDPQGNDLAVSGAGGTVSVIAMPGDCNADGSVTPGEFTSAINRFMGRAAGTSCLSFYGNVNVTPGYFTKVINCLMGRY